MTKADNFASDLKNISATVETDVGTIMKLVREQQATQEVPPSKAVTSEQQLSEQSTGDQASRTDEETRTSPSQSQLRPSVKPRPRTMTSEQVVLLNVTTRLRRETNERLTDAALRQRLKRETPATRQDIIEEALQEWLRRHGYSRGAIKSHDEL